MHSIHSCLIFAEQLYMYYHEQSEIKNTAK